MWPESRLANFIYCIRILKRRGCLLVSLRFLGHTLQNYSALYQQKTRTLSRIRLQHESHVLGLSEVDWCNHMIVEHQNAL